MSDILSVPQASSFPRAFGQRDAKIIETVLAQASHSIKAISTGITGTSLSSVAVGDICVKWEAASGLIDIAPAITAGVLPTSLLAADYIIVFRAN